MPGRALPLLAQAFVVRDVSGDGVDDIFPEGLSDRELPLPVVTENLAHRRGARR